MNTDGPTSAEPADGAAPGPSDPLTAADVDLVLVADDLAGALGPRRATELASLLTRDRVAADRYAEFARDLDGLALVLADAPAPPLPDDVLVRLDAALEREVASRQADETAHAAAVRRLARTGPRRTLGGWAAGLGSVAALVAVVAVVAVHTGGATGSSSSTAASAPRAAAAASERAPDGAAAGSAAVGSPSAVAAPGAESGPAASAGLRTVTAATLTSVVRAVYPGPAATPARAASPAGAASPAPAASPLLPATQGGLGDSSGCRPAGTPMTVRLLASTPVTFAGRAAVLLVLPGDSAHPGSVRATVVAACGGPALLSRLVTLDR